MASTTRVVHPWVLGMFHFFEIRTAGSAPVEAWIRREGGYNFLLIVATPPHIVNLVHQHCGRVRRFDVLPHAMDEIPRRGDACVDVTNAGQFGSMFRVRCRAPYAANV
jgi:hypothetical protein